MFVPEMVVFSLELVLRPPKCVHTCIYLQWLPLPWSKAVPGPKPAMFPLSVHTLIYNGCLCLSWEQHQSKRGWSRSPVRAGGYASGGPGKPARTPGSFQLAVAML